MHLVPRRNDPHGSEHDRSAEADDRARRRIVRIETRPPLRPDGSCPESFSEQARLAWHHVEVQLHAAGLTFADVVGHTTYLRDQALVAESDSVRRQVLGPSRADQAVIIRKGEERPWLIEIEAIAVA